MKIRTPAKPHPSASKKIKAAHARSKKHDSLKVFVRNSDDEEVIKLRDSWFHNKKANFSNPPLGIGSTRRKKNKQGKQPPKQMGTV